jgi:ParB-like chromosome segregation protein Spo0J
MQVEMKHIEVVQTERMKGDLTDLVRSVEAVGVLINPVTVVMNVRGDYLYKLISGHRRFAAYQQLGYRTIPVRILEVTELRAELASIDENLVRLPLGSVEFEEALFRRKGIYLELYPQTAQHVAGGEAVKKDGAPVPSFTKEVAKKLGVTPRTIERAIARCGLSPKVKQARIEGKVNTAKADILTTLPIELQEKMLPIAESQKASVLEAVVKKIHCGELSADNVVIERPKFTQLSADIEKSAKRLLMYLETAMKHEVELTDFEAIQMLKKVSRAIPKVLPSKRRVDLADVAAHEPTNQLAA